MQGSTMFWLAIVVAATISTQVLLQGGTTRVGDGQPSSEPRDAVRGMFVLKFPIRGAETFSAPRVGFDFQMQRKRDLDYLKESRDPETGRRRPEIDMGSMRTWSVEGQEFTLPDELQGEPENKEPQGQPLHSG
jgi:hypothetical protein